MEGYYNVFLESGKKIVNGKMYILLMILNQYLFQDDLINNSPQIVIE